MKYLISFTVLISFSAFGTEAIDPPVKSVSDLVVPLYESIKAVDDSKLTCEIVNSIEKCKPEVVELPEGSKIRILSMTNKGNYNIEVFSNNGESQGIFRTLKEYADKALNWSAVNHTLGLLGSANGLGSIQTINCNYGIQLVSQMQDGAAVVETPAFSSEEVDRLMTRYSSNADGSAPAPVTVSPGPGGDAQTTPRPEDDLPPYNGEYLLGCESLKDDEIKEENKEDLKTCVQSIRNAIAVGDARNPDGSLDRENLYRNMFQKLNPKEQAFAGKFFTAIGEVEVLDNKADYMSIMKVLKNRARFARQREGDTKYNELDVALSDWQFSMYNPSEPGWRKVLDPGQAINSKTIDDVLDAMATLDRTDTTSMDNIYMYHANYVTPSDWDMDLLSSPMVGLDFGNGLVTKSTGTRHIFYTPRNGLQGVYVGNFKKRRRNAN
jgi:hypothetical protein